MHPRLTIAITLICLAISGCVRSVDAVPTPPGGMPPARTSNDGALELKVKVALGRENGMLPYGVDVVVKESRVELRGEADSEVSRERLETIVAAVPGVRGVENHLRVVH